MKEFNKKYMKRANINQEIGRTRKVMKEQAMKEFIKKIIKPFPKNLDRMGRKYVSGLYSQALVIARKRVKK